MAASSDNLVINNGSWLLKCLTVICSSLVIEKKFNHSYTTSSNSVYLAKNSHDHSTFGNSNWLFNCESSPESFFGSCIPL